MAEDIQKQIVRRLDALILLSLDALAASTTTSKVQKLLEMGFAPAEVAGMIGKPVNYVTAITAGKRKSAKNKGKATKRRLEEHGNG